VVSWSQARAGTTNSPITPTSAHPQGMYCAETELRQSYTSQHFSLNKPRGGFQAFVDHDPQNFYPRSKVPPAFPPLDPSRLERVFRCLVWMRVQTVSLGAGCAFRRRVVVVGNGSPEPLSPCSPEQRTVGSAPLIGTEGIDGETKNPDNSRAVRNAECLDYEYNFLHQIALSCEARHIKAVAYLHQGCNT
jgi:hypothetical protein